MSVKDLSFSITVMDDMLKGSQDHTINIINDTILLTGGFQSGIPSKGGEYPNIRGKFNMKWLNPKTCFRRCFIDNIYSYNIKENNWKYLCKLNISPRQGSYSIVLGNKLYVWGGYSYTPLSDDELKYYKENKINLPSKKDVLTYSNGLCISVDNNNLLQKKIDIPNFFSTMTSVVNVEEEQKIYFIGGAYYNTYSYDIFIPMNGMPIGKTFFSLSYDDNFNIIEGSFKIEKEFTGSGRYSPSCFKINNFIYVIGGCSSGKVKTKYKGYPEYVPLNTIDNWKYNLETKKWTRISNLITPICNFGAINYKNDKIILFGGTRYNESILDNEIIHTSKLINKSIERKYNGISTLQNLHYLPGRYRGRLSTYNYYFSNLIIIYDIKNDAFSISNDVLPINTHLPRVCCDKNHDVYLCANEASPRLINNRLHGECSSLFLKIQIEEKLSAKEEVKQKEKEKGELQEWPNYLK